MATEAHNSHSIATTLLVLVALALTVFPGSMAAAATPVNIPDPGLDAAIRDALGIGPSDPITKEALADLESLDASNRGIKSLEGLEHCQKLKVLDLSQNELDDTDDTAVLARLWVLTKLEVLDLSGNNLHSHSLFWLWRLGRLKRLDLSDNNITGVRGLLRLFRDPRVDAGEYLDLRGNPLSSDTLFYCIPILQGRDVEVEYTAHISVWVDFRRGMFRPKGPWVVATIRLPWGLQGKGISVADIDVGSIRLNDSVEAADSILRGDTLFVFFNRSEVEEIVEPGEVELTLTGEFKNGFSFEGSDKVRVIY